jgi:hypothetical protein
MFCEMLNSHPMISCPHEPFADYGRRKNWREYLESLEGPVVIGHAHYAQLHSSMLTARLPAMLLERKAYQDGASSEALMGIRRPHNAPPVPPYYVAALEDERRLRTELLRAFATLTLTYEELTGGQDITRLDDLNTRSICDFLSVPVAPLTTTMQKRRG